MGNDVPLKTHIPGPSDRTREYLVDILVLALLWLAGLAIALYAAEQLVHSVTILGHVYALSAGLLGFIVALGADAPEVTSALVALTRGSSDMGMGVVLGSNIYNLAGLLGLSAILARRVSTGQYRLTVDAATNVILTLLMVTLVFASGLDVLLGASMLLVLGAYVGVVTLGSPRLQHVFQRNRPSPDVLPDDQPETPTVERSTRTMLLLVLVAVGAIVAGSDMLVETSLRLGPRLHIPPGVVGTFVLAIATSLPNTWAAISLARRRHASAAIAATFNSNSINLALGLGLPSLFLALHASSATRTVDVPWLFGMTLVAILFVATRRTLVWMEGAVLLVLYGCFVTVRLTVFG